MAENTNTVLHTLFRYKPDGTDKYVTIYFESSSDDVKMTDNPEHGITGEMNLNDLVELIMEQINERALAPIYKPKAVLLNTNPILAKGQFGIESDTGRFKIGNGTNKWRVLPYATNSDDIDGDLTVLAATSGVLADDNPIVPLNSYAIELDTKKIKLGDGISNYNDLKYLDVAIVDSTFKIDDVPSTIDYSDELAKSSYIPFEGQKVLEIDTNKYKVGDGTTTYPVLPYGDDDVLMAENVGNSEATVIKDGELCFLKSASATYESVKLGDGTNSIADLAEAELQFTDGTNDYTFEKLQNKDGSDVILVPNIVVDTVENLATNNPVLNNNQIAIASEPALAAKIGNGYNSYRSLDTLDVVYNDGKDDLTFSNYQDAYTEEKIVTEVNDCMENINPIILEDELVIQKGHNYISKLGDGETRYNALETYNSRTHINGMVAMFDTSENMENNQPIVPKDSLGIEVDSGGIKVGDGILAWDSLSYMDNIYNRPV